MHSYSGISQYLNSQSLQINWLDRNEIPSELTFLSYQQEQQRIRPLLQPLKNALKCKIRDDSFSFAQRRCLKNAFRYICRLSFKEARHFRSKIRQIEKEVKYRGKEDVTSIMERDAELISGQRYFRQYINNMEIKMREVVAVYLKWFLQTRYLTFAQKLSNTSNGKRKNMRIGLYIRFKNKVMLPYLHQLRKQFPTE